MSRETSRKGDKILSKQDLKDLAREEQNRYQREWRAKNKDRVKAMNERYWRKRVAKQIALEQEALEDGE